MEESKEITEKEEKAIVEVKPYMVFGREFSLSNPDIIDYYKIRMKMMSVRFKLVGVIDESGRYNISDEVRYDLIGMEKEIEDAGEDFYKAEALYMKKHFYFHIKITQLEEGKAKASLYLSEYVQDFMPNEYIVSHICDFIDDYDEEFRIRVRKTFNLVDVATKIDDTAVSDLAVIMQDAFDMDMVLGGLYDMASQIYVIRMLKALEESGQAGAKVLERYRQLLAESRGIEIDERYRYAHYKALLDRAFDDNGGYETSGLDPKVVAQIILEMNNNAKSILKASPLNRIEEIDLPNSNGEKSASLKSSSKAGGKKSAGDKAKKDNKKKDKKKGGKKKGEEEDKKKGGGVKASEIENLYKVFLPTKEKTKPEKMSPDKSIPEEGPIKSVPVPEKVKITKETIEATVKVEGENLSLDEIEEQELTVISEKTVTEVKNSDGSITKEVVQTVEISGTVERNIEENKNFEVQEQSPEEDKREADEFKVDQEEGTQNQYSEEEETEEFELDKQEKISKETPQQEILDDFENFM